ncbi:hypothetical protein HK101_002898 [Irineochytrium annulatum]|nr:hypothetical protein HK101_002898 [Irineochytrium annulatum]
MFNKLLNQGLNLIEKELDKAIHHNQQNQQGVSAPNLSQNQNQHAQPQQHHQQQQHQQQHQQQPQQHQQNLSYSNAAAHASTAAAGPGFATNAVHVVPGPGPTQHPPNPASVNLVRPAPRPTSAVSTDPTPQELQNLSQAIGKLWDLDLNRLEPGQHFALNLQNKTYVSGQSERERNDQGGAVGQPHERRAKRGTGINAFTLLKADAAAEPLFKYCNLTHFDTIPTYVHFRSLLNMYHAEGGVAESFTRDQQASQDRFLDELLQTAPMQYVHKYLNHRNLFRGDGQQFKRELHRIWFELYRRVVNNDSSSFEHTFVGETKQGSVVGFHNWIMFALEEGKGNVDYRGFILPRSRQGKGMHPTGREHVLSLQMAWRGDVKPVSTFLIGVSPEFEMALYTLCFFAGPEEGGMV